MYSTNRYTLKIHLPSLLVHIQHWLELRINIESKNEQDRNIKCAAKNNTQTEMHAELLFQVIILLPSLVLRFALPN